MTTPGDQRSSRKSAVSDLVRTPSLEGAIHDVQRDLNRLNPRKGRRRHNASGALNEPPWERSSSIETMLGVAPPSARAQLTFLVAELRRDLARFVDEELHTGIVNARCRILGVVGHE